MCSGARRSRPGGRSVLRKMTRRSSPNWRRRCNAPGPGTCFWRRAWRRCGLPTARKGPMTATTQLLLIDDDPDFAALVQAGLPRHWTANPLTLAVVDDIDAAIAHIDTQPVDFVLLDLHLPGRSGLDAIPALVLAMTTD